MQAEDTASRTSRPRAQESRTSSSPGSAPGATVTAVTPSRGESRASTALGSSPFTVRERVVPASFSSSSAGEPLAMSLPWLMMSTWSQTSCTSERMWELRMTVWSPDRLRIRSRISMICLGSRPTVGSSRMMTSGKPSRAWARPTRCR